MAGLSLQAYRKEWPRVGRVLAMAVGGAAMLASGRLSRRQLLSTLNFGALLVHQYEEYEDPGYFPGQFNGGMFKSATPRNYPLNTNTALLVNTVFAYPYYLAPILLPRVKWLGLSPALFGIAQAVGHGVIFPRIAGDKYSPGFLASLLLHVPIGLTYIRTLRSEERLRRSDWIKSIAYTVTFALVSIAGPNILGRDKNSPYAFEPRQMGRYEVS